MLFLLAPQSKIQDIQERQQRNHKPNRHVIGPDISHQHWGKGSACYSHNDIGWCFLCRRTHTFQAECKDCREHNGHEEKRKIERIQRNRTDRHDDQRHTDSIRQSEPCQETGRRHPLHRKTAGQTADHKQSHSSESQDTRSLNIRHRSIDFRHIINEETENSRLGSTIAKLCNNSPDKLRMSPHGGSTGCGYIFFFFRIRIFFHLYFG